MTERERWLVTQAFMAGVLEMAVGQFPTDEADERAEAWLEGWCFTDAGVVTVEVALDEEAPGMSMAVLI